MSAEGVRSLRVAYVGPALSGRTTSLAPVLGRCGSTPKERFLSYGAEYAFRLRLPGSDAEWSVDASTQLTGAVG